MDNLLLPVMALFFLVRALTEKKIFITASVFYYSVFIVWLIVVTVITRNSLLPEYSNASFTTLLAGLDAYLRPLFILFMIANSKVSRHDLITIIRCVLIISIPLFVTGIMQMVPATASATNAMITKFYINDRVSLGAETFFKNVLSGGRVMSIFGQVGTFGMFALLCISLLSSHFLGARIMKTEGAILLIVILAFMGGIASGSKVFSGGLIIMGIWFLARALIAKRQLKSKKVMIFLMVTTFTIILSFHFFPAQFEAFIARLDITSLYDTYFSKRLGTSTEPSDAKLIRTGAVGIFSDYPLTGLGFNVVGSTTDSFLFGILIMGGVIGGTLYALFITSVLRRLRSVMQHQSDKFLSILAQTMFVLSVALLLASIGFHTFIQDRSGDIYWLITGLILSPRVNFINR